jgi:hypothetical protein
MGWNLGGGGGFGHSCCKDSLTRFPWHDYLLEHSHLFPAEQLFSVGRGIMSDYQPTSSI